MPKRFSPNDPYFRKAQKMGYRARSAFKLEDILKRFPKFLTRNATILDLGCTPGSFLQVLAKSNPKLLVGVDIQETEPISGAYLIKGDIFSDEIGEKLKEIGPFRVITSDMAPNTTGTPDVDQYHSVELCERVLELSKTILEPNGNMTLKIFTGEDFDEFWKTFKKSFKRAKVFKPDACRDRSRETFLVGEGFLGM